MSEQHYGTAPCGCVRRESGRNTLCAEHDEIWYRLGHWPWNPPAAIEAGLRAIAGWPHAEGRFRATCGGSLCTQEQSTGGPGFLVGMELHCGGCPRTQDYIFRQGDFAGHEKGLPGWAAAHEPTNPGRVYENERTPPVSSGAFRRACEREAEGIQRELERVVQRLSTPIWGNPGGGVRPLVASNDPKHHTTSIGHMRLTCYWCRQPVKDGRCTACEQRQP